MRNLVAPQKLHSKTGRRYEGPLLPETFRNCPEVQVQYRVRQPCKSLSTYVYLLRFLAEYCTHGASLLRERLVCGINNTQIQRQLLSTFFFAFKTSVEEAVGQETATMNVQTLQGTKAATGEVANEDSAVVRKVDRQRKQTHWPTSQSQPFSGGGECFWCGRRGHTADKCHFRTAKCHQCGRIGYIRSQCCSQHKRPIMYSSLIALHLELQMDRSHQEYSLFSCFESSSNSTCW